MYVPSAPKFHNDEAFFKRWEDTARKTAFRFMSIHHLPNSLLDDALSTCYWTLMTIPDDIRAKNGTADGYGTSSYILVAMNRQMMRLLTYRGMKKRRGIARSIEEPMLLDSYNTMTLGDTIEDTKQAEAMDDIITPELSVLMQKLSKRERIVIERLQQGDSGNEIADLLDCSRQAVHTTYQRAIKKMIKRASMLGLTLRDFE